MAPRGSNVGLSYWPSAGAPSAMSSKSSSSKSALVTLVPILAGQFAGGTPSPSRVSTLTRPRSPRFAPRT